MAVHPVGVHVGTGLTGENELADGGPLARAAELDADAVQVFLGDPQGWETPQPRPDAAAMRAGDVAVFVHAPYRLNVASTNNRIRIPSRKLLSTYAQASAAIGARGMVVHGGHVLAKDDPATGVDNWRKTFARQAEDGHGDAPPGPPTDPTGCHVLSHLRTSPRNARSLLGSNPRHAARTMMCAPGYG